MTKRAQSKKQKNTSKDVAPKNKLVRFWKSLSTLQKILIDFAIFIVVGLIIYFSYAWYQGYMFRRVEKKMDTLTQEIIEEIGEPISQTKDQSCGYASAKYGKGNLGCSFINNLTYEVNSPAEATKKILNAQSFARSTKEFLYNSDDIKNFKDTSYDPIGWTSYKKPTNTNSCSISYYYNDKEMLSKLEVSIKNDSKNFILIRLSCGTDPLRPLFPVKE